MTLTKRTPRPDFQTPPGRILIIKPSAIGDVVHALPILNLLRKRWPDSHVSWLITPGCAGLLDGHPQVDEVIPFDRKLFGRTWKSAAAGRELATFGFALRQRKFDLVIDLQGLFRSGLLSLQTGAAVRVGSTADREFGWMCATNLAPITTWKQHALDRYLTVTEFLGLGRSPVEFVFAHDDGDRNYITEQLQNDEPYAVLLPGTNWVTKRWPVEKFAALVKPIRERFGFVSVLAGAPDAAAMAAADPRCDQPCGSNKPAPINSAIGAGEPGDCRRYRTDAYCFGAEPAAGDDVRTDEPVADRAVRPNGDRDSCRHPVQPVFQPELFAPVLPYAAWHRTRVDAGRGTVVAIQRRYHTS